MSKRGSGSSARTGGGLNLPSLKGTGTEKQVAWAEDLRKKWINEVLNKDLAAIKERKEKAKRLEGKKKEFNQRVLENTQHLVKAEKKVLKNTTTAKQVIAIEKNYGFDKFSNLAYDIADKSDSEFQAYIKKWAF